MAKRKECSGCHKKMSMSKFHNDVYFPDGKSPFCKKCQIQHTRSYYYRNWDYCSERSHVTNLFKNRKISAKQFVNLRIKLGKEYGVRVRNIEQYA